MGGLIAWLLVDKAAIELDEALNRDEFEADIHAAIDAQQSALEAQLRQVYGRLLPGRLEAVGEAAGDLGLKPGKMRPVDALQPE